MNTLVAETQWKTLKVPREIAALLSGLQVNTPDFSRMESLSDAEWVSLLECCINTSLTLVTSQLPSHIFPDWVIRRLHTNLNDNTLRWERVKSTYREAAGALRQAGIQHLVIKGFTQAPEYVPDMRLRSQSDFDIYCLPKDIDAASIALQRLGYRPSDSKLSLAHSDHGPALVRPGDWQWRGNYFDPEMPLGIELHYCLWNERVSRIQIAEVDKFWNRRTRREFDGLEFHCLSAVDHLAHLGLHILRNLLLGAGIIHHTRELAVFLDGHRDDDAFWQMWIDTHSSELRSLTAIAFYLSRAWFGCRLHSRADSDIRSMPEDRLHWLQYFSNSPIEAIFEVNKDAVWLHLALLSTPKKRRQVLKRALFPAHNIATIDSPAVQLRNKQFRPRFSQLWVQYFFYLAARTSAHLRASLVTLTRGLRWRLAVGRYAK